MAQNLAVLQVIGLRLGGEAPTGAIENSPAGTAGSAWGDVSRVPAGTAESIFDWNHAA